MRSQHGWSGSELPPDWDRRRLQVFQRDRYTCQECGGRATDVDHILSVKAGGSHDLANLQALCRKCHASKTGREGRAARRDLGPRTRPSEPHPGLIEQPPGKGPR